MCVCMQYALESRWPRRPERIPWSGNYCGCESPNVGAVGALATGPLSSPSAFYLLLHRLSHGSGNWRGGSSLLLTVSADPHSWWLACWCLPCSVSWHSVCYLTSWESWGPKVGMLLSWEDLGLLLLRDGHHPSRMEESTSPHSPFLVAHGGRQRQREADPSFILLPKYFHSDPSLFLPALILSPGHILFMNTCRHPSPSIYPHDCSLDVVGEGRNLSPKHFVSQRTGLCV